MRKSFVLLSFILVVIQVVAQVAKPLQFKEEIYDFGEVIEKEGPVMHQFEFTNLSNRPVKIVGVKPSCGCTTPDWTKEPIQPGKTGYVQARFDPKGRPGYFAKTLTVTTDADASTLVLQIKGSVTVEGKEAGVEFSSVNGNWKLKTTAFNFGKVYLKDEFVLREFPILNGGDKPITYQDKVDGPAYIRVNIEPKTLAPGERGVIKLGYNGKLKNQYGFQSDNITIYTDDELQPKKSFSVFATMEDYFPKLSAEEAAKAPKLQLVQQTLDFGRIKEEQAFSKEISLTNAGKSNLLIKAVQSNCTCVIAEVDSKPLKPGASQTVKISFDPKDRKGTQQKAITVYSNDPINPVQRITLVAYIED